MVVKAMGAWRVEDKESGGTEQSGTVVIQRMGDGGGGERGERRAGRMNGKGRKGEDGTGHAYIYTRGKGSKRERDRREGGREERERERACGGSIIPVFIYSPHIHSGAKLLS